MINPPIPAQTKGDFHDTVSMHCANNVELAIDRYKELQLRLKSVNEWHTFSDDVKATFTLFNPGIKQPTNDLEIGNLIRIAIPSIGSPSGHGYDWTQITDIRTGEDEQNQPFLLLSIKPCPAIDDTGGTVAHFYTADSSNTFIVRRVGNCIYAEVHGRNEIENTADVPLLDSVRNKAVAVGSKMGIGDMNWLGFTKALLEPFEQQGPGF